MNKKLMAAAVAGALVAPAAFAQSSTVQIYGLLNMEYGFVNQPNTAAGAGRSNVDALDSGASRIGFKGEEKLAGGMSAFWQCESDVRFLGGSTQSNGDLCDRNSALGLKGGFGSVFVGTWDSPMKRVAAITRVTNETGWLGTQLMTVSNGGAWTGSFSTRNTNTVNYDTPKFGGFSASFQYTTLQTARNNTVTGTISNGLAVTPKGRQMSMSGQYVAGPMAIVGAYSKFDKDRASGGSSVATYTAGNEDSAWLIGGTYQIGPVKLGLTYIDAELESGLAGATATTERKSWNIAGDWKLGGPHSVKFGYAQAGDAKNAAIVGGGNNTGAKMYQIGYGHALSKRTSASLSWARMDNDSAGSYNFTGHSAATSGDSSSVIVLGLVHTF
jgi:predicted porin